MKYIKGTINKDGKEKPFFAMVDMTFFHVDAWRLVQNNLNLDGLELRIETAGQIRMNKEGYITFGESTGLRIPSDPEDGKHILDSVLKDGVDFVLMENGTVALVQSGILDLIDPKIRELRGKVKLLDPISVDSLTFPIYPVQFKVTVHDWKLQFGSKKDRIKRGVLQMVNPDLDIEKPLFDASGEF